jgi:hypothetical protein
MKYLIAILFIISGFSANAQTNLRAVMVDTNGVVQRPTNFITNNRIVTVTTNGEVSNPTNFWSANSNSINAVVSNSANLTSALEAPDRFRNLSHAMASSIVGAGAIHSSLVDGRLDVRIVNGDTNARANVRVNRNGPWNGISGNSGINWGRAFSVSASGVKAMSTNNENRAFLILGAGVSDNDVPTNGNFVGLQWTNATNAQVIIGSNSVITTNGNIVTSAAADFFLWIDHNTNGTGDIYYAERLSATNAATEKPSVASFSYTNGPTAASSNSQTSLTFGLVTVISNSNFDIVGFRNVILYAP